MVLDQAARRRFSVVRVIATSTHLRYASGYLQLGLWREADRELRQIDPEDRRLLPVLGLRIELCMARGQWKLLLPLARAAIAEQPTGERPWIALAYALRELNRIEEARATLCAAEPLHGATSGLLHYNLACYECLLGRLEEARRRLQRAFELEPNLKATAGDDPDLAELKAE